MKPAFVKLARRAALLASPWAAIPSAPAAPDQPSPVAFQTHLIPFFSRFCSDCHGEDVQKAGIDFSRYGPDTSLMAQRKQWEKVREVLLRREMPPSRKPQPSEKERESVAEFIRLELARFDCAGQVSPGRVTLRRLNRQEYNNTIRDLLGVDFKPAGDFPSDEVGYGFDNIGSVLSLPPLLMEKYFAAAEQAVSRAIDASYPPKPPLQRIPGEKLQAPGNTHVRPAADQALGLYREGQGSIQVPFSQTGEYILRVRAYGEQAGPDPPKLALRLGDRELEVFAVHATASKPENYQLQTRVEAGPHSLAIAYLNNYNVQNDPDPELRGDRNLFVKWVEVEGPVDLPPPPPPESHRLIFICDPGHQHSRACAEPVLRQFAQRAYRRPVQPDEVRRLLALVDLAVADKGTVLEGIQLALQAILASPNFLFRWELDPEPASPGGVRPLTSWELASRLSYFLWSSMPDRELFQLAAQDLLTNPDILAAQVRRMVSDPKAEAFVENFAGQWLTIRNLQTATPDPDLFPSFDEELRDAMRQETELFFAAVMREDRSVMELIDADFTFLNKRLARHYGLSNVTGAEFQRVSLPPSSHRGGILTHASILTITSNPTRTSPVSRGKWILEQILGTPPPPPPPNVPQLGEDQQATLSGSLRKRMEQHRAKPECATCHEKMDPLGFAFEHFNAIGAWRDADGPFPIDATGTLPDGRSFNGATELKEILQADDAFLRCLIEKMLTYALGRGLQYYDKCAVDKIYEQLVKADRRFSALLTGVVLSHPFLNKQIGPAPDQPNHES